MEAPPKSRISHRHSKCPLFCSTSNIRLHIILRNIAAQNLQKHIQNNRVHSEKDDDVVNSKPHWQNKIETSDFFFSTSPFFFFFLFFLLLFLFHFILFIIFMISLKKIPSDSVSCFWKLLIGVMKYWVR